MSLAQRRAERFAAVAAEVELGPKHQAIRKFAIETASKIQGITPSGLIEAAKEIEAFIHGGDMKVTVTTA